MKVKLSEEQYNRLLVENDKDFLDGTVNFREIGNKVNKFIIKCYKFIRKQYPNFKQLRDIPNYSKKLSNDLSTPNNVCLIICYNYYLTNKKISNYGPGDNFSEFLGEPLEFYGGFEINEEIPVRGYVSGYQVGKYTGYASTEEEFLDQLEDGEYYDYDTTDSYVDYDNNIEWEVDEGYVDDFLSQRVADNRDDMIHNINLKD